MNEPLLSVKNLSKAFGKLSVIERVSFDISPGEIVGLTGSIGSGKSVLVMLLTGMYGPDEGSICYKNRRLKYPFPAQSLGIGIIHQKPTLVEHFDVTSNIFLGNEIGRPKNFGWWKKLDTEKMYHETRRILTQPGVEANSLHEKASSLSGEQRQLVAIARALTIPADLVIIDETAALLSYPFQQRLLGLVQNWRKQETAVLFSDNNLDHLFAVTDRIIVLNQGQKVADLRTDETRRVDVVSLLLGIDNVPLPLPSTWDYDSYNRIREHAEKLQYHQMLLGKDLEGEPSINRQLTEQLAKQVQALDQANLILLDAQRRFLADREEERKDVSRELHDTIIQDLLSINDELEDVEDDPSMPRALIYRVSGLRQDIRDLVSSLRSICGNLRPPIIIDKLGVGSALQSYTREWLTRTGISVELRLDDNLGRLPETTELSVFRIVQEGLMKVWRHARASEVVIRLQHSSPCTLVLSLSDNGKGIDDELDLSQLSNSGYYGIIGISEQVALFGGLYHFQPVFDGGAQLIIEIPHPRVDVPAEIHP